jgi:hypothetical protein
MTRRNVTMLTAGVLIVAIVTGCSMTFPATYGFAGGFGSEEIEFRPDHTFVYRAKGDDGPSLWSATGTWQSADRSSNRIATKVTAWTERSTNAGAAPLRDREVWTITRTLARRSDRIPLKRIATHNP